MMPRPFVLDDFDVAASGPFPGGSSQSNSSPAISEGELEGVRLQSYEKGYGAGWDDASKALEDDQDRISTEFARHLQELSFTYHEAHAALQQELSELVRGLVEKVLAPASQATLGEMLHARIAELSAQPQVPVEVLVAPENVARLERLVAQAHGPPLRLVAEPSLGAGQAFLRFGASEEQIDIDAVMSELTLAVERYFGAGADSDTGAQDAPQIQEKKLG